METATMSAGAMPTKANMPAIVPSRTPHPDSDTGNAEISSAGGTSNKQSRNASGTQTYRPRTKNSTTENICTSRPDPTTCSLRARLNRASRTCAVNSGSSDAAFGKPGRHGLAAQEQQSTRNTADADCGKPGHRRHVLDAPCKQRKQGQPHDQQHREAGDPVKG